MKTSFIPRHTGARLPETQSVEGSHRAASMVQTVELTEASVLSLSNAAGRRLCVESGWLWLTEPGDPVDHFIGPGQAYLIRHNGKVVLEGHGPSMVKARLITVMRPLAAIPPIAQRTRRGLRAALTTVIHALRAHRERRRQARDHLALLAASEERLRDIGAPESMIVAARHYRHTEHQQRLIRQRLDSLR